LTRKGARRTDCEYYERGQRQDSTHARAERGFVTITMNVTSVDHRPTSPTGDALQRRRPAHFKESPSGVFTFHFVPPKDSHLHPYARSRFEIVSGLWRDYATRGAAAAAAAAAAAVAVAMLCKMYVPLSARLHMFILNRQTRISTATESIMNCAQHSRSALSPRRALCISCRP